MNLNHARLPIPPLRQILLSKKLACIVIFQREPFVQVAFPKFVTTPVAERLIPGNRRVDFKTPCFDPALHALGCLKTLIA